MSDLVVTRPLRIVLRAYPETKLTVSEIRRFVAKCDENGVSDAALVAAEPGQLLLEIAHQSAHQS